MENFFELLILVAVAIVPFIFHSVLRENQKLATISSTIVLVVVVEGLTYLELGYVIPFFEISIFVAIVVFGIWSAAVGMLLRRPRQSD